MNLKFSDLEVDPKKSTPQLYRLDGSPYRFSDDSLHDTARTKSIVVTGAFPSAYVESGVLIETIRHPAKPYRLAFLRWENGLATVLDQIERDGRVFLPPDPTANSFPLISLPNELGSCGEPGDLLAEITSTISRFVKLRDDLLLIVARFILATWFPDCCEAAPYLWITGPLGSAKTKLLKLLSCLCRRGLIAGDLRGGSLYKIIDAWAPTLMIDELEPGRSGAGAEVLRILRTGTSPGVPTFRNGQRFSPYGLKVISLRQPLGDAALSSRGIAISMLPTEVDTLPLDEMAMLQLEKEFQPKLLMFRLKNYLAVKNFRMPSAVVQDLSPRTRQLAYALAAPLLGDAGQTHEILAILGEHDNEIRAELSMEPEWLVAEALFGRRHERLAVGRFEAEILVGGIAAQLNHRLETQGEELRLSAKKVGLVLKSLGLRTEKLGRLGRGLKVTPALDQQIHEIAQRLGIDRRCTAPTLGVDHGFGGLPCSLCDEYGLGGGLSFVSIEKPLPQTIRPRQRPRLFDCRDDG